MAIRPLLWEELAGVEEWQVNAAMDPLAGHLASRIEELADAVLGPEWNSIDALVGKPIGEAVRMLSRQVGLNVEERFFQAAEDADEGPVEAEERTALVSIVQGIRFGWNLYQVIAEGQRPPTIE